MIESIYVQCGQLQKKDGKP